MKLSREEVLHVAELAKLGLSEKEIECFQEQLSAILNHINILNELDTSNVMPMAHVTGSSNVLREDIVKPSLPREEILKNSPLQEEGSFRVPAVLEE